jgi:hypothetical protein
MIDACIYLSHTQYLSLDRCLGLKDVPTVQSFSVETLAFCGMVIESSVLRNSLEPRGSSLSYRARAATWKKAGFLEIQRVTMA